MPKVNIEQVTDGYIVRYNCECGADIEFHTQRKPKRLMKCFDCIESEGSIFSDPMIFKEEPKIILKIKKKAPYKNNACL